MIIIICFVNNIILAMKTKYETKPYNKIIIHAISGSWMTPCLGKSCSFGLLRVPFVNCCQFMYLVVSLLVLRAGCGIWLYQFLNIAYLFPFLHLFMKFDTRSLSSTENNISQANFFVHHRHSINEINWPANYNWRVDFYWNLSPWHLRY